MVLLNRDISWLSFNLRVLQQAADENIPLYERLKFLSIFSSNLNEFFRVRYPEIIALSLLNKKTKKNIENFDENIAEKVQEEIKNQLHFFGKMMAATILPELKKNGIIFYFNEPIRPEHIAEVRELFFTYALSYIQLIYLDEKVGNKFTPANNRLYFIVSLEEGSDKSFNQAIVNIPSDKIQRFFTLLPLDGFEYVIFLDDILRANLKYLFPGQKIVSVYSIKINRDAELHLEDEYSGNLLHKIEKQLKKRDFGLPSRLLFEAGMPRNLQLFLSSIFSISFNEMFSGGTYHNLEDLTNFPSFGKNLFFEKRKPLSSASVLNSGDIFKILIKEDILLHVPYQTYNPVLSFFNQAAVDVNVTEIYITLYRVAEESHIVNALISAAKNGKRVVVFIELKARFDEANNIKWSKIMKQAGVTIIYSIPGIKVHSKIALVKKKKETEKQYFAILGTGNFNEVTAQFYTDHVLMTSNEIIAKELLQLFKSLESGNVRGDSKKLIFHVLLVSQFNMIPALKKLILNEIAKAKNGEPAMIRIKVNNLEEPEIINLLYEAGKAGVMVNLLIRSICCIVPGVPNMSENIQAKRIVDRYLEHSRFLIFGEGDNATVIMGSADLMTRNLKHRIEVFVKIKDASCKQELIDYFELQWLDNDKSVWLLENYQQTPVETTNSVWHNAQESIYRYLSMKE